MTTVKLYEQVVDRAIEARQRVLALSASDDVKSAVLERLLTLISDAAYDLTRVSREVELVHADLDAGVVPLYGE